MTAIKHKATIEAAVQELLREKQVRERCYPRWVKEGKQLNQYEADERLDRIGAAIEFLQMYILHLEKVKLLDEPPVLSVVNS